MSNISQERLHEIAAATRARLEPTWERHPDRSTHAGTPPSYKRCADSIWHLLNDLWDAGLNGIDQPIQRHMGRLAFAPEHTAEPIYPHQWLTVARFALDITGDQTELASARVVCASPEEQGEMGLIFEPYKTWDVQRTLGRWDEVLVGSRAKGLVIPPRLRQLTTE